MGYGTDKAQNKFLIETRLRKIELGLSHQFDFG